MKSPKKDKNATPMQQQGEIAGIKRSKIAELFPGGNNPARVKMKALFLEGKRLN
jgi:hypothetical protein